MQETQNSLRPMQELFTAQQAAHYLGVSDDTVRRLARLGQIPIVEITSGRNCRTWRFHRKDVDDYIARQKRML